MSYLRYLCLFAYCGVQLMLCYVFVLLFFVLCDGRWEINERLPFASTAVRFVFTPSCFQEGACLIYIICVCLRIVVSNTCCVMFLFCFSLSCVTCVTSFYGLFILTAPLGPHGMLVYP